jgi:hypothetical protein
MRNRYEIQNRFVGEQEAIATRARLARRHSTYSFVDEAYDLQWAKQHKQSQAPNSYYDYFFAGPDIKAYIAELADDPEFGDMPIHGVAFNIEQQKTPVYGYWSYTYDAVMRGTRLVSGQLTLITKYPGYMREALSAAAANRSANRNNLSDDYPAPGSWRSDDENIERYWGKHIDVAAQTQGKNEWSIHPPFSLVIVYGVQNTSVQAKNIGQQYAAYESDNALLSDHNQRLVESYNGEKPSRLIIDGCELVSCNRSFTSELLVAESYSFFGRDIIVPPAARVNRNTGGVGGAGTHFVQ